MKVKLNIQRLIYLLSMYQMTEEEFLTRISKGLKNTLPRKDIFTDEIKLSHLKRIDKVFDKGIHFYLDPAPIKASEDASIFFRKNWFDTDLNLGSKKIVTEFEDLKISLSGISKLADIKIERVLPVYDVTDSPTMVAKEIREKVYPEFKKNKRDFLKALIERFAEYNILVFEFIEAWNKTDKANIDGFFLSPNVIVIKRHQKAFRREIFTLAHELAHYLLNEEEVEKIDAIGLVNHNLSVVERWCNDFAFTFLAGEYVNRMDDLNKATSDNDYHSDVIDVISKNTHLSKLALYTRLLYNGKISSGNYKAIRLAFDEKHERRLEEERRQKEINKLQGIKSKGFTAKPINSPLLVSTIQSAYYEGVISEYDVCKALKIKPEKLYDYIQ